MTTDNPKPTIQTKEFFDYHECKDYLEKKYQYEERSYKKKRYDFWLWLSHNKEITNGCYIVFDRETLEEIEEDWVKEIYARYLDEFADKSGSVEFHIWW